MTRRKKTGSKSKGSNNYSFRPSRNRNIKVSNFIQDKRIEKVFQPEFTTCNLVPGITGDMIYVKLRE